MHDAALQERASFTQHLHSRLQSWNYLLIILSEEFSTGSLVNGLSDSNDLPITVANGHAQQRLGFVARQLVDFIAESTILQTEGTGEKAQCKHLLGKEQLLLPFSDDGALNVKFISNVSFDGHLSTVVWSYVWSANETLTWLSLLQHQF